jgi:hypothetical protein
MMDALSGYGRPLYDRTKMLRASLPSYWPGKTGYGKPMLEASKHREEVSTANLAWRNLYLPLLHYRKEDPSSTFYTRAWLPATNSPGCPRPAYSTGSLPLSCDEYPNFSTFEGGPAAGRGLAVKPAAGLATVDREQNRVEGFTYGGFVSGSKSNLRNRFTAWADAAKTKRFLFPGEGNQVAFLEYPVPALPSFYCSFNSTSSQEVCGYL